LYSWSARAPLREEPPLPPLPHQAFELKEVIAYNRVNLQEYAENHLKGPNDFPKWDRAKRLMCTHTIEAWDKKVRARGKHLKAIAKRCTKLRIDLHRMPINHLCRGPTITVLTNSKAICPVALDRLIANLTLTLNEEEAKELDEPISSKELLAAIIDSPKGKSPGTDCLPYECYKANPNESATILAAIGNLVPDKGTQPQSWTHNNVKGSKYLGVITGCNSTLASKAIAEREAHIYRQIESWDTFVKARAFTSMWVDKYLQNMTNPVLQSIQAATDW
jgi:hypothetical protein